MSEYYEKQKRKLIINIIIKQPTEIGQESDTHDPIKTAYTGPTLKLNEYSKKVVGKPKYNWWIKGLEAYWEYIAQNKLTTYEGQQLQWNSKKHMEIIQLAAMAGWGLEKHELSKEQFEGALKEQEKNSGNSDTAASRASFFKQIQSKNSFSPRQTLQNLLSLV